MATFTKSIGASLTQQYTGLAGSLGYTVLSSDLTTVLIARTTAGVTEKAGGQGIYAASVAGWDDSWSGTIFWDYPVGTFLAQADFEAKTGYSLAAAGLDAISTTAPTGVASNFREMMVQLWRRFFKRVYKDKNAGTIRTYADDGTTVITTQAYTTTAGADTTDNVGAAS